MISENMTPPAGDISSEYKRVAGAFFARMRPELQDRAKRLGRLNLLYVTTPRDDQISKGIDELCQNAVAELHGASGKRRALFVIGESDSGKTEAVRRHLAKRDELRPYVDDEGKTVTPLVSFDAPKPMTMKGFARAALKACGYPASNPKLTENELFELLKTKICQSGTLFMFIDEMQHIIKNDKTEEIQNVADVIKSLLQIPGWPLHLILCGVPSLARIINSEDAMGVDTDRQLRNRSLIVELRPLRDPTDVGLIRNVQAHIATMFELRIEGTETEEFFSRLFHACNKSFGTIVQSIKRAVGCAVDESAEAVTVRHFAQVYAQITGCHSSENIFTSENWRGIVPGSLKFSDSTKTSSAPEPSQQMSKQVSRRKSK